MIPSDPTRPIGGFAEASSVLHYPQRAASTEGRTWIEIHPILVGLTESPDQRKDRLAWRFAVDL
jgi:hypothetical protein